MKINLILLFVSLLNTNLFAIEPVEIADNTFKIGAFGEENFYYGFAAGDEIVFSFHEMNENELKEIEIIELPNSSKFMDFKSVFVENKKLKVNTTSIYQFRFKNGAAKVRICRITIKRIPANDEYVKFDSNVYWKTMYDTTYTTVQEKYLISKDTSFQEFYSGTPFISSQNALNGNRNYQIFDLTLPENTASWSFYIGTGSEGKEEYNRAQKAFLNSAAKSFISIPGYGPMASLALTGVSYINQVQGEDNVKYYFLSTYDDVLLFNAGQTFMQYKMGNVVNEASQMKAPLKGKVYLALINDNTVDPITVMVKATAVIIKEVWGTRPINKMNITSRQEAYLKN